MLSSRLFAPAMAASAALVAALAPSFAAADRVAGGFETVLDDSLASAMMLALIDENNVMVLDKAENNRALLDSGKPVWGSIIDISDDTKTTVRGIDVTTNTFCASGLTLGNGSWVVVGGNQAVQNGGAGLAQGQDPLTGPYKDYDGRKAIRILDPQTNPQNFQWIDNQNFMQSARWYPGIEGLPDGSIIMIGGATGGGYINRNTPVRDVFFQANPGPGSLTNLDMGGANPTWEFFPNRQGYTPQLMQFMGTAGGLNMYPHTYLMPSGLMFLQANYSTILWDWDKNQETALPDMPGQIVRVYPASAATAMLPLTPDNSYTPTILFCGGTYMTDDQWGNYSAPNANTHQIVASDDCSSITPETSTGKRTNAGYVHEEKLPEGRTMGQFIHLPDETMVIVNGANKGTAGYGNTSFTTVNVNGQQIQTEGLAQDPTYVPVLYDPSKPRGSRLTRDGFAESPIARLYHSSAILIPDGSVLIAGSNPHQDVSLDMPKNTVPVAYNTEYAVEKWYPPYYFKDRPKPQGLPNYILFGGNTWNFTIGADYMGKAGNFNGNATKIMVIRPGFSTHAMNMGQRSLRLAHTYTVNEDGSVVYMVNPMPTNQNLFVAGPALLFVTVNGIPSHGKMVMIGHDGTNLAVPTTYATGAEPGPLPAPVLNSAFNSKPSTSGSGSSDTSFGIGKIVGVAVGAAALFALIGLGLCLWRRHANRGGKGSKPVRAAAVGAGGAVYGMSSYANGGAAKYDRVDTPNGSMHGFPSQPRGSMGTFDSYRGSLPGTPYFDNPRAQQQQPLARSPLGDMGSPQHLSSTTALPVMTHITGGSQGGHTAGGSSSGHYSQQGWGEHQAAGDVGAEYYRDGSYSDPSRYYDSPAAGGATAGGMAQVSHNSYGSAGGYGSAQPPGSPYAAPSQGSAPYVDAHQSPYAQGGHDYYGSAQAR